MVNKIILSLCFLVACWGSAGASTYYINGQGNDAQAGTSPATAWRSIDRVNEATFQAGDRVLFAAGQTFAGSLTLQTAGLGSATSPIVVSSYGKGVATIYSGDLCGLYAYNIAGIEVRRLAFVGSGRLTNKDAGISFYLDLPAAHLTHLRLDSLDVSGYLTYGISVGSWQGTSGYTDVRITACQVHANGEGGLGSYSEDLGAHQNWYVGNCQAFDNSGRADVTYTNTGNGIVLSGIDGALIENCVAYHNGWLNANQGGGPVGIWGYCCNNLVIQHCESHHNMSGTEPDGGGFDLDGGCTNSVLQYNYSHDNEGPGYELCQYRSAPAMHDLTVRYNVSINDARRHGKGALQVWSTGDSGGIQRAAIYNNTVLLSPPADGSSPKVIYICTGGFSDLSLRNNVLQSTGNLPMLNTAATTGLRMEGNCYWNSTQLQLNWNGTIYTDLAAWRAATTQEQLATGRITGLNANPNLTSTDPTTPPPPASPVLGAGLSMQADFNISPGPRDFVGNPTPPMPMQGNIGALETQVAPTPLPVVLTAFTVARNGQAAILRWLTAAEQGNAYFEVESSRDGHTFASIGRVAGQGISRQAHSYSFEDSNLARYAAPVVYYRLYQVDSDGKATYSPVQSLASADDPASLPLALQVYPQPAAAAGLATVKGARGPAVQVLTARGQLLATVPVAADGTAGLPLAGLAPGVYLVQCGAQHAKLLVAE